MKSMLAHALRAHANDPVIAQKWQIIVLYLGKKTT